MKNKITKKSTIRDVMQILGTNLLREGFNNNIHVASTLGSIKENEKIIITDMRFPNELEAIKKHNGITIRINRGLVERTGKLIQEPEHISETALDDAKFDYIIENNGTIEELLEQVKKILIKEEII